MSDDIQDRLWRFKDEHRGRGEDDQLTRWLAEAGDLEDRQQALKAWIKTGSSKGGGMFFTPPALVEFIARIASKFPAESLLDPTCGSGLLAAEIANRSKLGSVQVVDINEGMCDLARKVLPDDAVITHGDVTSPTLPLQPTYDLIVSEPPFGMRLDRDWQVGAHVIENRSNRMFSDALAYWCTSRLADDGTAILILPSSFYFHRARQDWQTFVGDRAGIRACIHIPSGGFQGTTIDAYVVVIDRQQHEKVFIGQYTANEGHQAQLIDNMLKGRDGRHPAQGRLVEWSDFRGFITLDAQERVAELARRSGLQPVSGEDLFIEINRTRHTRGTFEKLESKPNSIYMPDIGNRYMVTSQDELPERVKHYLQLVLDEKHGDARYVVEMFKQEIGQAMLDAVGSSLGGHRRISVSELRNGTYYLPPIDIQQKLIDTVAAIRQRQADLDRLETELWASPRQVDDITEQLPPRLQEEPIEDWFETLPFPLASILWRYRASSDGAKDKGEILLKFFEAFAEFLATIHLSALAADEEIWNEKVPEVMRTLRDQNLTMERATFGTWVNVFGYLAKTSRQQTTGDSTAITPLDLLRTRNPKTIEMLCDKKLVSILQRAIPIRNSRAHGGFLNHREAQSQLDLLEDLLSECRASVGRRWQNYELLQAGKCDVKNGLFHHDVKCIMGTRTPFRTDLRECIEALESNGLYMLDPTMDRGLALLPFLRVMPSPQSEDNACYFYSQQNGNESLYVSYHFDSEPRVNEAFADTTALMQSLMAINTADK